MQISDTPKFVVSTITRTGVRFVLLLVLITLASLVLRVFMLGRHDYWDDEMIVTFVIRQPLGDIYRNVMVNDSHPPLYHMLLRLWTLLFGADLWTQRLFSALVGTACVPATYWLGRLANDDRRVAMLGAVFMALAPFQIYHSQQARMYALLTLIVPVLAVLFVRAWQHERWWRWALVTIVCTAGMYTHVYFWFSLLACDVWIIAELGRTRRVEWRRWAAAALAQCVAVVLFLPFVPTMFGTVTAVVKNFWIRIDTPFDGIFNLVTLANNALSLSRHVSIGVLFVFFIALGMLVFAMAANIRWLYRHPQNEQIWMLLQLLIWVPIIVATVISLTIRPILLDRSLIGLSAPLFLVISWAIVRYWNRFAVRVLAILYTSTLIFMTVQLYITPALHNDLLDVANRIAAERRAGDAIAYADWEMFDASALAQPELPDVYALPTEAYNQSGWLDRMRVMRVPEPHRAEPVSQFGPHYERVWVVFTLYTPDLETQQKVNLEWLRQHGRELETYETARSLTYLFEITTP